MIFDALALALEEHPDRARPGSGWPCCELVARVVLGAAGVPLEGDWYPGRVGGPPAGCLWADAMVLDGDRPWSSAQVWGRAGLAHVLPDGAQPKPGLWHVVQGWRSLTEERVGPGDTGHTWLWYAIDAEYGHALESSERHGVRLAEVHLAVGPEAAPQQGDGSALRRLLPDLTPEPWARRAERYGAGVAVAVLREPLREVRPEGRHSVVHLDEPGLSTGQWRALTDRVRRTLPPPPPIDLEAPVPEPIRPASLASLPQALAGVDLDRLAERAVRAAQGLVGDGPARHRRAVRLLAQELDDAIEWGPGPAGRIAEALDGPVLQLLLGGIVRAAYERVGR